MENLDNMFTIPTFISNLWNMIEDPTTDDIICWSKNGKCFLIFNKAKFWVTILPRYYKHSNMSSFIRQLNMYGFHKVSTTECDNRNERPDYQFTHINFRQNQPNLLINIKRKVSSLKTPLSNTIDIEEQFEKVTWDVKSVQTCQSNLEVNLNSLKQENAALWQEIVILQQKYQKQQQILNKLIQFLITVVQPSPRYGEEPAIKKPLMIQDNPQKLKNRVTSHSLDENDLNTIYDCATDNFSSDVQTQDVLSPTFNEIDLNCGIVSSDNCFDYVNSQDSINLPELNLSQSLMLHSPIEDYNIFGQGYNSINIENLKKAYLKSALQDPVLTSIFNDNFTSSKIQDKTSSKNVDENVINKQIANCRNISPVPWVYTLYDGDDNGKNSNS